MNDVSKFSIEECKHAIRTTPNLKKDVEYRHNLIDRLRTLQGSWIYNVYLYDNIVYKIQHASGKLIYYNRLRLRDIQYRPRLPTESPIVHNIKKYKSMSEIITDHPEIAME